MTVERLCIIAAMNYDYFRDANCLFRETLETKPSSSGLPTVAMIAEMGPGVIRLVSSRNWKRDGLRKQRWTRDALHRRDGRGRSSSLLTEREKRCVKGQKRFEQILLVESEAAIQQPLSRVVVRKENVVYVYPDARLEARQHFEKLVTDITAELDGVTRIDEENVVRFEA